MPAARAAREDAAAINHNEWLTTAYSSLAGDTGARGPAIWSSSVMMSRQINLLSEGITKLMPPFPQLVWPLIFSMLPQPKFIFQRCDDECCVKDQVTNKRRRTVLYS